MKRLTLIGLAALLAAAAPLARPANAPLEPAPATATAAAATQDVDSLARDFARKAVSGSSEERRAALDALVATGESEAMEALADEFARVTIRLREAYDDAYRLRYTIERKEDLVASLETRAERDRELKDSVRTQKEKLRDLRAELEKAEGQVDDLEPWRAAIVEGSRELIGTLSSSKQRRIEKDAWSVLEDDEATVEKRLASVELLGSVGSDGTALSVAEWIEDLAGEAAKIEKKLPRMMADVRKLEARMQKEARDTGGYTTAGQQYERVKEEATAARRAVLHLAYLREAAAEAGGRALAREEGAALEKSIRKLLRAQEKAKDGARADIIALLGHAGSDAVATALREALLETDDPAARAGIVTALAAVGDTEWVDHGIETLLADESFHVKRSTALALAKLRVRRAIPALIDGMEREIGRTKTDYQKALTSLTGQDFRSNVPLWRRWWAENEEDFEVPSLEDVEAHVSEEAKEAAGLTFFGIRTDSRRVLFVLDLSGSMNYAMVPRGNPDDDPNKPPDEPRSDEQSRLEAAKTALTRALGGIDDGAVFNIVFYASDVWTWQDELVDMTGETRSDAMRYVEDLDAVGGTNIYGALSQAFDLAGVEGEGEWEDPAIDTIFFLSDGRPSVGITTDPDEILAYVRDRNESAGIVIHTIGLSGAQDAYLMRSLAEQNGGDYVAK